MRFYFFAGAFFLLFGFLESQGITRVSVEIYRALQPHYLYSITEEGYNAAQVMRFFVQTGYYLIGAALIGIGFYLKAQRRK